LNQAWESAFNAFNQIKFALPNTILSKRQRLDFTAWYTDSMTDWCEWWALEARRAMPKTRLYQSAGGWGFREAGTDYSAQTKSMAKIGDGGVRLTNETDSYEQNFFAKTIEGDSAAFQRWTSGNTGQGAFYRFPGDMEPPSCYGEYVRDIFQKLPGLHPWTRMALATSRPPAVFLSVQSDGHLLALNYDRRPARISLDGEFDKVIEPYGILRVRLPDSG
jgi:hypothetical protein